jgi:hypothetical protein
MESTFNSEVDSVLRALGLPFEAKDIEWRVGQAGEKRGGGVWAKVLAYITNRAIMQRLDDTVGPSRWKNEFKSAPEGDGVLCGISIYINSELGWVTKWDGASNTDIEAIKGGLSNAMKRAAVQWCIGRYLYDLEGGWATILPDGEKGYGKNKTKDGTWFDWNPPDLPSWALPVGAKRTQSRPVQEAKPVAHEGKTATSEEVLDLIKRAAELSDDVEITIARKKYPLKQFIKDNWNDLKQDAALATVVSKAVEKALS